MQKLYNDNNPLNATMIKDISPIDLQEKIVATGNDLTLLDVREPWEFEIAHIEKSLLIPMGELPNKLNDIQKDKAIVVICHHGIRSRSACMYLHQNGINNLLNLHGGIDAWAKEIDSNMPTYS